MRLIVCDEREVTEAERAACQALWGRVWPPAPDPAYHNIYLLRALLFDQAGDREGSGVRGALVGACQLIEREIAVDGEAHRIAGLARVAVEEARRGRRYGTRIVAAALAEARLRGYGFGVLFCRRERRPFYDGMGWRALEGPVTMTIRGEVRPLREGGLAMALPLTPVAEEQWPRWQRAPLYVGVGGW